MRGAIASSHIFRFKKYFIPEVAVGKRRITRYNDTVGPDFSSGMIVLTIFMAAVIILCVYFVCNRDTDPYAPDTGTESGTDVGENNSDSDDDGTDTGGNNGSNDGNGDSEGGDTSQPDESFELVTVSNAGVTAGYLILVNNWTEYNFETEEEIVFLYGNDEKSKSYGLATVNISCAKSILPHLNSFLDAYYDATEDGKVVINSGHRTYDDQNSILEDRIDSVGEEEAYKYVAIPGYSEHHTGYALDIASYGENYDPAWMPGNCWRYGFIQRYTADKVAITGISYEYWHYRYVGAPHAEIMVDENLCMEEYIELIKGCSYDEPYYVLTETSDVYMIYTVAMGDGENTEIPVPKGAEYEVSGNNVGGFVVTVKLDGTDGIEGVIHGAETDAAE